MTGSCEDEGTWVPPPKLDQYWTSIDRLFAVFSLNVTWVEMLFLPNKVLKSLQNQLSVCWIYEDKVGVYSQGYADADPLSSYFPFITDKEMQALAAAYPDAL